MNPGLAAKASPKAYITDHTEGLGPKPGFGPSPFKYFISATGSGCFPGHHRYSRLLIFYIYGWILLLLLQILNCWASLTRSSLNWG